MMKYKLIIAIYVINAGLVGAQDNEYKPAEPLGGSIEIDGNTQADVGHTPSRLSDQIQNTEIALQNCPDDATGKKHPEFERALLITQKIKVWNESSRFVDLCDVFNPVELFYYSDSWKTMNEKVRDALFVMLDIIHREPRVEITKYVKQNNVNVDPILLEKFISAVTTPTWLIADSDWEFVDADTIDSAGLFILDHSKVTTILKIKNKSQIREFVARSTGNEFFKRYEEDGDGLPLLKAKYAANKNEIQIKFAEVLAHAAELEAQSK